ncbi:hypothetical protein [Desulfogranum mediterraneum]|uniref:hypothetical protein n=1 Tax=Desulfogranum mediterraneum TaxID=160661 RepID=UPI00048D2F98|nr:hypothetical protein [Desulfogranum mediterraneum]
MNKRRSNSEAGRGDIPEHFFRLGRRAAGAILTLVILLGSPLVSAGQKPQSADLQSPWPAACYLDDNFVLLYKIINWWNTSLPEDDTLLCGETLRCQHTGKIKVSYRPEARILTLNILDQFGDMVSALKQCRHCSGPGRMECSWLHPGYFADPRPETASAMGPGDGLLTFRGIPPEQALLFQQIEKELSLVLEGRIGGLLLADGTIALHRAGTFLKPCPQPPPGQTSQQPSTLLIKNRQSNEIIAKYVAIYDQACGKDR